MMGKRAPLRSGDEYDVFSRWRHVVCWTSKSGATARVKRQFRRHERAIAKRQLQGDRDD